MEYLNIKHQKIDDTNKAKNASKLGLVVKDADKTKAKLAAKKNKKISNKKHSFFGRVTSSDQMLFLGNLATMLKAGLALAPALVTLTKETKNKYFRAVLQNLYQLIENGQTLSDGMKQYPNVFPEMIISTVEVGENSGSLSEALAHLADILESQKKLKSKVVGALVYPIVVIVAVIGVSLFLAFFVFPQLVAVFEEAEVKLPAILVAVNFIINAIQNYGYYVALGFLFFILILFLLWRIPKVKLAWSIFSLKIPFVGNLIKEYCMSRFASNLRALFASGLPIVRSLEIVAKTVPNLKYRQEIFEMAKELEKGHSLSEAMADRPKLFSSISVQLCHVGEQTGELDGILEKIGAYYEDRVNNVLTNLSAIIEPILLVTVGIAVGFIALSVISPMYELTQSFAE
jgi:type II secretory pathway component PulF